MEKLLSPKVASILFIHQRTKSRDKVKVIANT